MNKKKFGQFFTQGNTFDLKHFSPWMKKALRCSKTILEPFAGSNNLINQLLELGYKFNFKSYDIEPKNVNVLQKDTIQNFPTDFKIVVTNPPWLAKNSAKRRNILIHNNWSGYDNLYKLCLKKMLNNASYIAVILPASFININTRSKNGKKKSFFDRLESLTFLNYKMFDETDNPSCLALFVPEKVKDTKIFISSEFIGNWKEINSNLQKTLSASKNAKIKVEFNKKNGNLGVITIDTSKKKNIKFVKPEMIPANKIKHSSRHIVRIFVNQELDDNKIKKLNEKIDKIRNSTKDVVMTPFKGLIKNTNCYRRRMNFSLLRKIIISSF